MRALWSKSHKRKVGNAQLEVPKLTLQDCAQGSAVYR